MKNRVCEYEDSTGLTALAPAGAAQLADILVLIKLLRGGVQWSSSSSGSGP
ncbi:MAG: hypothetical protein ABWK01_07020 [Infirmifilum sp.]